MKKNNKVLKIWNELNPLDKIKLTEGIDNWNLYIPKALGEVTCKCSDGPVGIREVEGEATKEAVSFPSPSLLACSFDSSLVERVNEEIGKEAKLRHISAMLTPAINLKRNPLCGRNFEYYSEDPILSGKMGAAAIRGIEKNGISSCLKHYIANTQEYGRYTISENIDDKALHELYLKNFMIAVKEGHPKAIMTSYNLVNHEYVNESKELLELPRKDWGFDGIYYSDWSAINNRKNTLLAGCDLEMPKSGAINELLEKDKDPAIFDAINSSSQRILSYILSNKQDNKKPKMMKNEGHELAIMAVASSLVLLKNEEKILPLQIGDDVCLIGKLAENPAKEGNGSAKVNAKDGDSLGKVMSRFSKHVYYAPGYNELGETNETLINEAIKMAKLASKVVFVVGKPNLSMSEALDQNNLNLPSGIERVFQEIKKINPNIILLVECGSPLIIPFRGEAKGLLVAYYGGEAMNEGLALGLYGIVVPSGRLAETWPLSLEDTPIYNNYTKDLRDDYHTESIYIGYRYYEKVGKEVAYNFGYGLSYSSFLLKYFHLQKTKSKLIFKVEVENTGEYDASVPVLIYSSKKESDTYRPSRELVGFGKTFIKKGEVGSLKIEVPREYLEVYDFKQGMILENGEYVFDVCFSSDEIIEEKKITIANGLSIQDESRFIYHNYFNPKDNTFDLQSFEKLYKKPLVIKDDTIGFNSVLQDFLKTQNGIKIEEAIFNKIDEMTLPDSTKAFYKMAMNLAPFRITKNIVPLYTDDEYKIIFDVASGKNPNYGAFLALKGL